MVNEKFTITLKPQGNQVKVSPGAEILDIVWGQAIEINSICGGEGTCGKCRGKIVAGKISEPTNKEMDFLSEDELKKGVVLLCQRKIIGDLTLELEGISDEQKKYTPVKGFIEIGTETDPIVTKTFHQLSSPTRNDPIAGLDRILNDLPRDTTLDIGLMPQVPRVLTQGKYNLTTTVFNNKVIVLESGDKTSQLFGIAFDIGTTSVAGYLINLQSGKILESISAVNKQRIHGADVISRISYTVEKPDGLLEMKDKVTQTIDGIIKDLLLASGIAPEHVCIITLVGNTVMSHFLLGVSPVGMAKAPFVPVFTKNKIGTANFLGLKNLPGTARFILLPNIAGYVGSDTVGVILSTKIFEKPGNWLAVDIGTNGEVILSTKSRLLTCSTAAGPAFEGAFISHGMRAEPGAICKVEIKNDVKIVVIGDQKPKGICGSGLVDTVSELIRVGIVRTNGRIKKPDECPKELPDNVRRRIKKTEKGYKFVVEEGKTEVAITQKDISELQLGKGAIRAGIEVLLQEAGITNLDGVLLAGAFGNNSRPKSLIGIGMFPDIALDRIQAVGNAAGNGAIMALLSKKQLKKAFDIPNTIEHVELSLHKSFQRQFARAISFE